MTSSKPYLIRAIYEWILDNGLTPHLVVDAEYPGAQVPVEFIDDGRIVLNIAPSAVKGLVIGNDWIQFNARFSGVAREVMVPSEAALGVFTRENGQGMVFPEPSYPDSESVSEDAASRPKLRPLTSGPEASSGEGPSPAAPRGKGKGKGGPTLKVVK
ncbi:ClpXP protease specificity-enhancing factor [Thiorhodococcus mannitoliphagus]|uniref:ClpXP protease specificity-enhancing factor n=2 Tax=Thiorhodococcus mannitoliphagus TaxID=329406 RepID=A0A6P1E1G1_9GAMM|nr:ClpXP protease specificity-enhancing factor [Thiorhodococcus mannitoliphagus]